MITRGTKWQEKGGTMQNGILRVPKVQNTVSHCKDVRSVGLRQGKPLLYYAMHMKLYAPLK